MYNNKTAINTYDALIQHYYNTSVSNFNIIYIMFDYDLNIFELLYMQSNKIHNV